RPVFIHINKTAGTSIVRGAGDRIVNAGHRTASSWITEHGRPAPLFSVVRHPYDRVRSEYDYRRRRRLSGEDNPHLANLDLSLDDWVVATFDRDEFRTTAFFERNGVPYLAQNVVDGVSIWFMPQFAWSSDGDGSILVDDVLRFEQLGADREAWCDRYGIDARLPHENRSAGGPWSTDDLGPAARQLIVEHHRVDFEVFGYPE
ncbi:MAG: hypothetical protein ACO4CU_14530, partial [Ilumatobacteraceae bacterium]